MSVDEKWNANFARVQEFFKIYNRKPSEKSKENDEKGLGIWISTQNQNYKNRTDGMKNEERRDIWSKFLEDNKQCFRSDD